MLKNNVSLLEGEGLNLFISQKSNGVYLYNNNGDKLFDLSSGNIFGHNNIIVENAIVKTLHANLLFQPNEIENNINKKLKTELCKIAGFFNIQTGENIEITGDLQFCNSAKEAIENAIKIARTRYNTLCDRNYNEIICLEDYDFLKTTDNYGFKKAKNISLNDIEKLITEHTSAILIETISLNSKTYEYDNMFWKNLRNLCDKHEILLLLDETKCGCGKTGTFFAYQKYDIKPDIVCIGNDLAGGLNFGACIFNHECVKFYKNNNFTTNNMNIMYLNIADSLIKTLSSVNFYNKVKQIEQTIYHQIKPLQTIYNETIDYINVCGLICCISFKEHINIRRLNNIIMSNGILVKIVNDSCIMLFFPAISTEKQILQIKQIIQISIEEINIIENY